MKHPTCHCGRPLAAVTDGGIPRWWCESCQEWHTMTDGNTVAWVAEHEKTVRKGAVSATVTLVCVLCALATIGLWTCILAISKGVPSFWAGVIGVGMFVSLLSLVLWIDYKLKTRRKNR